MGDSTGYRATEGLVLAEASLSRAALDLSNGQPANTLLSDLREHLDEIEALVTHIRSLTRHH
jgi:hypothetical protein